MNGIFWVRTGAAIGALAVAAGAFGAHALRDRIDVRALGWFETAAHYQIIHALALVAVGLVVGPGRGRAAACVAGWSFLVGTLIFAGTLDGLALGGPRWLGAITPIGGTLLIVGWTALGVAAGSGRSEPTR